MITIPHERSMVWGCCGWDACTGHRRQSLSSEVTTLECHALPCHLLVGDLGQPPEFWLLGILAGSKGILVIMILKHLSHMCKKYYKLYIIYMTTYHMTLWKWKIKKLYTGFQRNGSRFLLFLRETRLRIQIPGSLDYYDTNTQLQVKLLTWTTPPLKSPRLLFCLYGTLPSNYANIIESLQALKQTCGFLLAT